MVEKIKPLVRSTRRPGADGEIGGFGGLFDLKAAGFIDPVLVAANDGVGTKLKIAIESGRHDTIGIDLVAMCVNDLVVQGAEPLFFLDYFATGKLDPEQGAAIVAGIAEGCRQAGCALIGGETAEMPGMYRDGDYDLAGFAVGAAERGQLLPTDDVVEGDVLLGLASSGIHSNGFSLVRRIVAQSGLGWTDAAPFADGRTLADALLEPTRIYVQADPQGDPRHAWRQGAGAHHRRRLPRQHPARAARRTIRPSSTSTRSTCRRCSPGWRRPAASRTTEMMRTFNCGIGMVAVVAAGQAAQVAAVLQEAGETVTPIGRIVPRRDAGVIYRGVDRAVSAQELASEEDGDPDFRARLEHGRADRGGVGPGLSGRDRRRHLGPAGRAGPGDRRRARHPDAGDRARRFRRQAGA